MNEDRALIDKAIAELGDVLDDQRCAVWLRNFSARWTETHPQRVVRFAAALTLARRAERSLLRP